jgi:selenocysteine-specific elongation factor
MGGGWIVDSRPPRRRAADRERVGRLQAATGLEEAATAVVEEAGAAGVEAPELAARLTVPQPRLRSVLDRVAGVAVLRTEPPVLVARSALARLSGEAQRALERFHREHPLDPGMPREELRSRVFGRAPVPAYEWVLEELAEAGTLRLASDTVALAEHEIRLSSDEEGARAALLAAAREGGLAGVEVKSVGEHSGQDVAALERVARVLAREGTLERVGEGLLVHREHADALKRQVRERWAPGSRLDVPAFKEMTGLSRKYVIPLLEYLDREKVTRRSGKDRVVLG